MTSFHRYVHIKVQRESFLTSARRLQPEVRIVGGHVAAEDKYEYAQVSLQYPLLDGHQCEERSLRPILF